MKYSLLKVVQSVLASMDSDEVESIHDNTESEDVVIVAEDCFYEMMQRDEWPHIESLIAISSVSDLLNPTALKLEDDVRSISKLRYDCRTADMANKNYQEINYLQPNDFIDKSHSLRSTASNVITIEPSGGNIAELFITNDAPPSYYTALDDSVILFDSYDAEVESYVQNSKVNAHGEVVPRFKYNDDYIIDFPEHMHPLYLAEVKAVCHVYFKQQQSPKDEQKVLRNISRLRRTKHRTGIDQYDLRARKDFGRHARPAGNGRKHGRR